MTTTAACSECGAANEVGVRRCRVCARLLDASVAEDTVASDPLLGLGAELPPDASSADIARVTGQAMRQERLRRRPGFLDRVFKGDRSGEGTDPPDP